jgi:hypothetical protein
MKTATKLQKRKAKKINEELAALNAMRANPDLYDAVAAYIVQPHLTEKQRDRLRAVQSVLCHAPLKKVLAFL